MFLAGASLASPFSGRSQSEPPASTSPASPSAAETGPRIKFATNTFDFGQITSGDIVRHDFIFTNTGTATLEILNVKPACGCTTSGPWDKTVEPGKTGTIPLQLNSASFGGRILKPATVFCNDPRQTNVVLHITGTVWQPIDVSPTLLVYQLLDEGQTNLTKTARITSHLEENLTLSEPECTNQSFRAKLETVTPGREYALHVTALPPFATSPTTAEVTLKSSSKSVPELRVKTIILLQKSVTFFPNRIVLPPGPLTNDFVATLMVRNSGTNVLILDEPAIDIPRAAVEMRELEPGRQFSLLVRIPSGFELEKDRHPLLKVPSNHPTLGDIVVPVLVQADAGANRPVPGIQPSQTRTIPTRSVPRPTASP